MVRMPVVKQGELHGPLKQNFASKNNNFNKSFVSQKEDLNKFDVISKKLKKN